MDNVSPMQHLTQATKKYPNMSSWVGTFLKAKGEPGGQNWPNWCFLPMAAWAAIIQTQAHKSNRYASPMEVAATVGTLSAIGTWRYSQGIYRMDAHLLAELARTECSGALPCDVLRRLPEWCVYVETPGLTYFESALHGFWAHLEWDMNHQREELRLVLNTSQRLIPEPLHLGEWSVEEAVTKALKVVNTNLGGLLDTGQLGSLLQEYKVKQLRPLISILLYLCSEEPDIDPALMPEPSSRKSVFRKGKSGLYLFTPEKPKIFNVGSNVGRSFRNEQEVQLNGRSVKAHLRRGHWHGFWKGPRLGDRTFIYRWISPLVVKGKRQMYASDSETGRGAAVEV